MERYEYKYTLKDYWPLAMLFVVSVLTALVAAPHAFMHHMMGMVFLLFAVFKMINITGFVEGLGKYDLLAQKVKAYAYLVPFIEFAFALAFFAHVETLPLYAAVLLYTGYNAVTVKLALKKGLDTRCACLGTALNLPLSTVSFWENIVMAGMTLIMMAHHVI